MGAKPSSAVQQSAYLEALDDYIDFYEDGTLRKCLLDEHGNRLKDKEGNLKTLRHRFAVYCDDICAGADTIEELYELFEALICCCKRAGIQVKASKVKFGVIKVTFHNYTITREGTQSGHNTTNPAFSELDLHGTTHLPPNWMVCRMGCVVHPVRLSGKCVRRPVKGNGLDIGDLRVV